MCLADAELPRKTRMVDRGERRCTGPSVIAGNQDHLRARLCDAGGNRSDARLGHEFDGNSCVSVCIFQIVNELRQILDRVNVMVRRR